MSLLGNLGGTAGAIGLDENLLMMGVGASLVILDVTQPNMPIKIAQSENLAGYIADIEIAGEYAYVAIQSKGLVIFNVADPAKPQKIATVATTAVINGVDIKNQFLLLAEGEVGLRVLDISNPAQPVEISRFDTSFSALDVTHVGDYAFVADGYGGLQIINLSNPADPKETGSFPAFDYVLSVEIAGNYAYLADGYAGLVILDVQNRASPVFIKEIGFGGPSMDLAVIGNHVFINALFYENGVYVVDIANPPNAAVVDYYQSEGYPRFLVGDNRNLFISDYSAGLRIVDITSPPNPVEIGTYTTGIFEAIDIKVSNQYAYVAGEKGGFHVINICDSTKPTDIGVLPGNYSGVDGVDNIAYLSGDKFQIIDLTVAEHPTIISSLDFYSPPKVSRVFGNQAYIAAGKLYIYNVNDPALPKFIADYQPKSQVEGLDVFGNYVYLAMRGGANPGGLEIVNVTGTPTLIGSLPLFIATDVKVSGHFAYLAASDNTYGSGLFIVDISNPTNPILVAVFPTLDVAAKVTLYQHFVLISSTFGGLYVLDVTDPTQPNEIGYFPAEIATGVDVENGYVYLANGAYGLDVLKVNASGYLQNYHICGTVTDFQGRPIGNVGFGSSFPMVQTQQNGNYFIASLPAGTYTLEPEKTGYHFWPSRHTAVLPIDLSTKDFKGSSATLQVNHQNGAPSSYFWFSGQGYAPLQHVTVFANGRILGEIECDPAGNLSFRVSTDLAEPGLYYIYTDYAPLLRVVIELSSKADQQQLDGSGPIFALPLGIAYTDLLYLPAVNR